ncbi:T-lymphocyte activation antigen CD86-like isoform X2 [Lissotriton helveticus]
MRHTALRTAGSQRVQRRRNHCPTQEREPTMGRDNIQKSKQPARRNSSSVMKPCIVFVAVMAALPGPTAINGMTVLREDTALLPCKFNAKRTVNSTKVVYWQKAVSSSLEVVLEAHNGQEKPQHQDPKYLNRTKLDSDGSSLILQHVGVQDEGTYQCIVSEKPQNHLYKIHDYNLQLKVIANFSHPSIAQEPHGKLRNGTTVNLTCSSVGGYPAPKRLDWIISGRNETIEGEMQTPQDDDTKLYNVTSRLTWFFTDRVNISCRIQLVQDLGSLSSEILSVELEDEVINSSNGSKAAIPVCVIAVILIGVAGFIFYAKKRKKCRHASTDADGAPVVCDNGGQNNRDEVGRLMGNDADIAL